MRDFLQTADPVDCVVLDALMPGEASISLVLHLKKVGLPVVVISGSPDAMEHAAENNLQLLRKPFHAQELYDAVNTALSRPHVRLRTGRPVSQYAGNEGCAGLAGAEPHA